MKAIMILLLEVFFFFRGNGQNQYEIVLNQRIKTIDSLIKFFDSSRSYITNVVTGGFQEQSFLGEYFYYKNTNDSNEIGKVIYRFNNDSIGKKCFYYSKDELVKVQDNGKAYYYYYGLYDKSCIKIDAKVQEYLMLLERQMKPLIDKLVH